MNYGRLIAAAVAATIVDLVFGFVVYGMLLRNQFASYPAIFRPVDVQAGHMPEMVAGIFLAMLAATWIYSKGYEGGAGLAEGVRFGVAVGLFLIGYVCIVDHSIMNLGRRISGLLAIAAVVEWLLVGAAIGLAYRPFVAAKVKPANV